MEYSLRCKKKKKASVPLDMLMIIIFIMLFAVGSIIAYSVFNELNTDIQSDSDMDSGSKAVSSNLYNKFAPTLDSAVMFAFILLIIFVIVSVFMIDSHPIFFIILFIILVGVFLVAMLLANSYDDIMSDAAFSTFANEFTYTTWIMRHLLELSITTGFIILLALFIKMR